MPEDPNHKSSTGKKKKNAPPLVTKEKNDADFVTEPLVGMKPAIHRVLLIWLLLLGSFSVYSLIDIWPMHAMQTNGEESLDTLALPAENAPQDATDVIGTREENASPVQAIESGLTALSRDQQFLLIALFSGILGGSAHGLLSLMNFRGNRRLFRSWSLWYFGLPIAGGMVALIMYIVVRAGLFSDFSATNVMNPYGVAAIGAIVGLFTDNATAKLAEVLDSLFSTKKAREGTLGPKRTGVEEADESNRKDENNAG